MLALFDVFLDLPKGDQNWQIYLIVWAVALILCLVLGLVMDLLGKLLGFRIWSSDGSLNGD